MVKGLRERLRDGESIVCAEGYMWELERRGYIRSGAFTPEVVLDHPEQVKNLHEEFVHAGSDVVEAFTYYGHRQKMSSIGREGDLQSLNEAALRIAREVADSTGTLMAGGLSNTNLYDPDDPSTIHTITEMFKEQVDWMVRGGADYLIGETFADTVDAKIALEVMKKHGQGLPIVITLTPYMPDVTSDGVPFPQALRQLEEMGADVVGLNCGRGPHTMLPLLKECRKVCKGPMAALPVPYRTTDKERTFQSLTDPKSGEVSYPLELFPLQCTRKEVRAFAEEAKALGVNYIGLCCGNSSVCLREVAVAYGKNPPSCKYSPILSHSIAYCDLNTMPPHYRKLRKHMCE